MSLAERLYRMLLWLYPAEHRRAYGGLMVQHARDLNRTARSQGRWQSARLGFWLLKDGVLNAGIEHLEVIKMAKTRFKPLPWSSVLLAAYPGLLVVLSRQTITPLAPILAILGYLYLGILLLAPPVIWWRRRRIPVWTLLPAGLVLWLLTYLGGTAIVNGLNLLRIPQFGRIETVNGIAFLDLLLALGLFVILLRGRRLPVSFWPAGGLILAGYLLLAFLSVNEYYGSNRLLERIVWYLTLSGIGPTDGLLFVAAGLLAVRRHGVLAILVVIGGYAYMCFDSDYLWGSAVRDWPYIAIYLIAITALYLVVTPVALLRARTSLGRAAAVFVPVAAFHLGRLIVPGLVIQGRLSLPWGDSVLSANVLLSLALAWVLYSKIEGESRVEEVEDGIQAEPLAV